MLEIRAELARVSIIHSHVANYPTGPSPRIEKWSGGGSHRVPKAREGESMRRGLFPLSLGGFGGLPEKIFEYLTLLCAFLLFFMRFGPDFSRFGHKDISCRREKPNAGQNCFQTITCCCFLFFYFFQHVSLTLFHLHVCPLRF